MSDPNEKWQEDSSRIIKSVLARSGVTYSELVSRLSVIGVEETVQGIKGKLHRGTFSFMWALQCCRALDIKELRLE